MATITADSLQRRNDVPDGTELASYLKDLDRDASSVLDNQRRAQEDMVFLDSPGGMWVDWITAGWNLGDRIRLEMDTISQHVRKFNGRWQNNRVGVDYKPADGKTDAEDAELMDGLYRADFRDRGGRIALDNAIRQCSKCGVGGLKLGSQWCDEADPFNEHLRMDFRAIYGAHERLYWDNAAQDMLKTDAQHATLLDAYTTKSFKQTFEGYEPSSAYAPHNYNYVYNSYYKEQLTYVGTRYEVKKERRKAYIFENLETGKLEVYNKEQLARMREELEANPLVRFSRERWVMRRAVYKTVFSGRDILEKSELIAGEYIPLIPFYCYWEWVDGEQYKGLIRELKDAQRLWNSLVSQVAENAFSGGQNTPIFLPEQMNNPQIRAMWGNPNNLPYLLSEAYKDPQTGERIVGPVGYRETPALDQNAAAILELIPQFIQQQTGGAPQDTLDPDASGKAINALLKVSELDTQEAASNIEKSIQHMGVIYASQAPQIYEGQQEVLIVSKDGGDALKTLRETVADEENGVLRDTNVLDGKKFNVYADIGPQYDSLRDQTIEDLKGMMELMGKTQAGQQFMPLIISVMLENIDGPGLDPIKDAARRFLLLQGAVKPEGDEEEKIVAAAQQQAQQPNPQQMLVQAAAQQQMAEAENLRSKSLANVADAQKKDAETDKLRADILAMASQMGIKQEEIDLARQKAEMDARIELEKLSADNATVQ